jgi:hypothetical protein
MPSDNAINLPLLLPTHWWLRLQRVAGSCYSSPRDFVREAVEAEIVRRELLLEEQGDLDPQWLAVVAAAPAHPGLQ